jgi:hypothetical protein
MKSPKMVMVNAIVLRGRIAGGNARSASAYHDATVALIFKQIVIDTVMVRIVAADYRPVHSPIEAIGFNGFLDTNVVARKSAMMRSDYLASIADIHVKQ